MDESASMSGAFLLPHARGMSAAQLARLLRALSPDEAAAWAAAWREWAHDGQREPPGGQWRTWVMMAGRGFGKTRAGAEWVHSVVRAAAAPVPVALVAATIEEARRVMVEGPSGLLATARAHEHPVFLPSLGEVRFAGGSVATLYSGANPDALRGPQHGFAWCDELAKWRHPAETWDMLQLGLRVGARPRALVTTTPRAGSAALRRVLAGADVAVTGGPSGRNPHLPAAFLDAVTAAYGGSALGRQEIDGVLADEVAGSLWPAALIEASRGAAPAAAALARVVVGVDPPASAGGVCGIVVCGVDAGGVGHVLADWSAGGLSPEGWARRVAAAARAHGADRVVVETNQGGDMVRAVLRAAAPHLPLRTVTATRGKAARAEPVAALFESGQARLAGRFDALEAELTGLSVARGYEGPGRSPDRADAMVWALWALLLAPRGTPRVRAA